jgi:ribosomal protein S18 acetylase RimI-like enzyme
VGHGERLPPGTLADDFFTKLRSGLWRLGFELSAEGKKRFFDEFLPLLHETKKEVLGELDNNSWYLVYIGTKTSSRGQGFAKTLINDIKEQVSHTRDLCERFMFQHRLTECLLLSSRI